MTTIYGNHYPDMKAKTVMNNLAQFWSFSHRMKKGDIAVLPLKTQSTVALGTIASNYRYKGGRHIRKVDWIQEDIPRKDFGQDLLNSLGSLMAVCQLMQNSAEDRLKVMLAGKPDPNLKIGIEGLISQPEVVSEDSHGVDLEEQTFDKIRGLIESKFKDHNMIRLVEEILNVQGFQTSSAPQGMDGEAYILAGYGVMGFDPPRLCVQVASEGAQNEKAILKLEKTMGQMKAEQGLFVSWEGFDKAVLIGNKERFFKIRLWDDKKLMTALLENYEKMSDQIQAELPLIKIWVVAPEEG